MTEPEFDSVALDYTRQHQYSIRVSGEDPIYFARYKISYLRKLLPIDHKLELLDFGCGIGNSIGHMRELLPNVTLLCADVSGKSLEVARAEHSDAAEYLHIQGDHLPMADDSVDIAYTACVFHHIDPEEHIHWLSELIRVVRPGGLLAIIEHNPRNPLTVKAVNDCPFDANAILISPSEMRRRASKAGWRLRRLDYIVFFPAFAKALRPLEPWLTWCGIGAQYVYVGEKPS